MTACFAEFRFGKPLNLYERLTDNTKEQDAGEVVCRRFGINPNQCKHIYVGPTCVLISQACCFRRK